jgi:hypothetical protein
MFVPARTNQDFVELPEAVPSLPPPVLLAVGGERRLFGRWDESDRLGVRLSPRERTRPRFRGKGIAAVFIESQRRFGAAELWSRGAPPAELRSLAVTHPDAARIGREFGGKILCQTVDVDFAPPAGEFGGFCSENGIRP